MAHRPSGLLLALASTLLAACDDGRPRLPSRPAAPPRPPLPFRGSDAGRDEPATESPPTLPDAGPRAMPAALAQCVARSRRALPAELSAALGTLDDASLLEDACRLDMAPRARDPALCEGMASDALREACLTRTAVALREPERCPATPGLLGRDPVCVALAARNPGLCAAAPGTDRARCVALAHADGRACARLATPFREACARDLAATGAWILARPGDPLADAEVTLDVTGNDPDAGPLRTYALRDHRRGAWLDESGTLWLMDPATGWPRDSAAAGDEPVLAARVPTSGVAAGAEVAAEVRLLLPGALPFDTGDGQGRAMATFARVPHARGDGLAMTLRIEGATGGRAVRVVVRVAGFVRDLVPAASLR